MKKNVLEGRYISPEPKKKGRFVQDIIGIGVGVGVDGIECSYYHYRRNVESSREVVIPSPKEEMVLCAYIFRAALVEVWESAALDEDDDDDRAEDKAEDRVETPEDEGVVGVDEEAAAVSVVEATLMMPDEVAVAVAMGGLGVTVRLVWVAMAVVVVKMADTDELTARTDDEGAVAVTDKDVEDAVTVTEDDTDDPMMVNSGLVLPSK